MNRRLQGKDTSGNCGISQKSCIHREFYHYENISAALVVRISLFLLSYLHAVFPVKYFGAKDML